MNKLVDLKGIFAPEGSKLRESQLVLINILKVFDEICKKNGVNYCLAHGTLLGAVRHKGFVPWDDDIDIIMFPDEYKKLNKLFKSQKSDHRYVFHSIDSDFNYPFLYPKFRDESIEGQSSNPQRASLYKFSGVGLDIFPLQRTNTFVAKICNGLYYRLVCAKHYKIRNKIIRLIYTRSMQFLLIKLLFPIINFPVLLFGNKDEYHHQLGIPWYHCKMYRSQIVPTAEITFEDGLFPCPRNYDLYLKSRYGDYMKLPSINQILNDIHSSDIKTEITNRLNDKGIKIE